MNANLTEEQEYFLHRTFRSGAWSYNPNTRRVDVKGNVKIPEYDITKLPVYFGEVSGDFRCEYCRLISLAGCPRKVGGDFAAFKNRLTDFRFGPVEVGGIFSAYDNPLETLVGFPELIGGYFVIDFSNISKSNYEVNIPLMERILNKGIAMHEPERYYYPYRDAWLEEKAKQAMLEELEFN